MFRGIFFSCVHYTEASPVMRRDNYGELILKKLQWILNFAYKKEAKVICCGDLFHRKAGTTIREINKILNVLDASNPLYCLLGNHDCQGFNKNLETQPIGVLQKSGKVILMEDDGFWKFGNTYITGTNYSVDYEENDPYSRSCDKDDCLCHIHLTHGMLTNMQLPFEATSVDDIEISAKLLINGHFHRYWSDEERGVYNVGSIARIAMDKNEIVKQPVVLLVEVANNGATKVSKVKVPIEKDVWITEIKRDTLDAEEVMKFAESIQEMELDTDTDILKKLLEDQPKEVAEKVYRYVGE